MHYFLFDHQTFDVFVSEMLLEKKMEEVIGEIIASKYVSCRKPVIERAGANIRLEKAFDTMENTT